LYFFVPDPSIGLTNAGTQKQLIEAQTDSERFGWKLPTVLQNETKITIDGSSAELRLLAFDMRRGFLNQFIYLRWPNVFEGYKTEVIK